MTTIAFIGLGNMGGPWPPTWSRPAIGSSASTSCRRICAAAAGHGVAIVADRAGDAVAGRRGGRSPCCRPASTCSSSTRRHRCPARNPARCSSIARPSTSTAARKAHAHRRGTRAAVARRAGLGRRRRRRGRHPDLHGRRLAPTPSPGRAAPRSRWPAHRPLRRRRRRPGGQDLQQHDPRHLDDRRRARPSCWPRSSACRTRRCSTSPRPRRASAGR